MHWTTILPTRPHKRGKETGLFSLICISIIQLIEFIANPKSSIYNNIGSHTHTHTHARTHARTHASPSSPVFHSHGYTFRPTPVTPIKIAFVLGPGDEAEAWPVLNLMIVQCVSLIWLYSELLYQTTLASFVYKSWQLSSCCWRAAAARRALLLVAIAEQ